MKDDLKSQQERADHLDKAVTMHEQKGIAAIKKMVQGWSLRIDQV